MVWSNFFPRLHGMVWSTFSTFACLKGRGFLANAHIKPTHFKRGFPNNRLTNWTGMILDRKTTTTWYNGEKRVPPENSPLWKGEATECRCCFQFTTLLMVVEVFAQAFIKPSPIIIYPCHKVTNSLMLGALGDKFWKFIFSLRPKNDSIQNSIQNKIQNIHSKRYSFNRAQNIQ